MLVTPEAVAIRVAGLTRTYQTPAELVRAVDGVSFTAGGGEFVCVYGTSGSGKSTLLHLLAGLDEPQDGSVTVGDQVVSGTPVKDRARLRLTTMGVVFQHDNLIEEFTALENVAFPLELRGAADKKSIQEQAHEWLDRVGISDLADRYPTELSGGQQQRVGIARALVGHRKVLIADEPTGALDSANSRMLFALIKGLCSTGVTAIVTSHDPVARTYADRCLQMVDGRIEADRTRG